MRKLWYLMLTLILAFKYSIVDINGAGVSGSHLAVLGASSASVLTSEFLGVGGGVTTQCQGSGLELEYAELCIGVL